MIAQRTTQTIVAQHPVGGSSSWSDFLVQLSDDLASVLWVLEGERRGLGHLSLDGLPRVEQLADASGTRRDWVVFSVVGGSLDIVNDRRFPHRNRLRPGHMFHAVGSVRAIQGISDDGLLQPWQESQHTCVCGRAHVEEVGKSTFNTSGLIVKLDVHHVPPLNGAALRRDLNYLTSPYLVILK